MSIAYVAVGANLGDRRGNIDAALALLHRPPEVCVRRVSSLLDNPSVGGPAGAPDYLNGAAEVETSLSPEALLERLLEIEHQLGRRRRHANDPRPIDLDLLLYEDRIVRTDRLILPHPRLHQRRFVLQPLAELAATRVHPVLGRTIEQLLKELNDDHAAHD